MMVDLKHSFKTGISFGLTSGIITTLGLVVGLSSSSNLKSVVIGGILTIAIADAFSDALGIHISEESEAKHSAKEIWESTIATFIAKFLFASLFIIPVSIFELQEAVIASIIMGLTLLAGISFFIAKSEDEKPVKVIVEHLLVAIVVIVAANYVGLLIARYFGQ